MCRILCFIFLGTFDFCQCNKKKYFVGKFFKMALNEGETSTETSLTQHLHQVTKI